MSWLEKFEKLGIKVARVGDVESLAHCPLHKDTQCSFSFNMQSGLWKCFAGCGGGTYEQLCEKLGKKPEARIVPLAEVEEKHAHLLKNTKALVFLRERRGITEQTVLAQKIGFDGERYWIPVFEKIGPDLLCVNVRKWLPKRPSSKQPKILSYQAGYGSLRLYPFSNTFLNTIILFEGEMDCILALQMGLPGLTVTGGAGGWSDSFTPMFKDKEVFICYDIDAAGLKGSDVVAKKLYGVAKSIKIVRLPITDPPNGDFTDYIVTHGYGKPDFLKLLDSSLTYKPDMNITQGTEVPIDVSLLDSSLAEHQNKRISTVAQVVGKDLVPYVVPKCIKFECHGGLPSCQFCSIPDHHGCQRLELAPESQTLLQLSESGDTQKTGLLKRLAGINPSCSRYVMTNESFYNIEEMRLIPEITYHGMNEQEYVVRTAYRIGQGTRPNGFYKFTGIATSHPQTQRATIIASKLEPLRDSIASFTMTPEQVNDLRIFNTKEGQHPYDKMVEIAKNLSYNATRIFERDILHMVVDCVFHSVSQFKFQKHLVRKGWCEALLLGDTRCGKTETANGLLEYYKVGEFCSSEAMSFAGLVGGLQQIGDHWSITWGKLAINDKRLLIMDEISSMPLELIGQLSGVRSNGIAEVTKIQTERTHARCRLIWMSNPRSPRPINSYDHGVEAVKELIGRPEDIARFDIISVVTNSDVPLDKIHELSRNDVSPVYAPHLCQQLILWAWSRNPDQIKFTPEAEDVILTRSSDMAKIYSPQLPIVEPNEQRFKLARLSAAVAARVFSTDDGVTLKILPCHVDTAYRILTECLNNPALGYLEWSRQRIADNNMANPDQVEKLITDFGYEFCTGLLDHKYLRITDFEDLANLEKTDAKKLVGQLVRFQALKHYNTAYIKTPAFIKLLRDLQQHKEKFQKKETI